MIGASDDKQVFYDVSSRTILGYIASPRELPRPGGDVALSPNGHWLANGSATKETYHYDLVRLADNTHLRSPEFSRGNYVHGPLRIDPAPRWNRTSDALLVSGLTRDETRQLFVIRIRPRQ